jgi:hypothetical protein
MLLVLRGRCRTLHEVTLLADLPPGLLASGRACFGIWPLLLVIRLYFAFMRDQGIALQVLMAISLPCCWVEIRVRGQHAL